MKKVILYGIRSTLLELGSATKVEISQKLGISFPTISKFITQLELDGELVLVGVDDSSGGRRPKRYAYNPEHMLGLAIFLERTDTNYTIFNCLGVVKDQGKTSSVLIEDGLKLLTKFMEEIIAKYPKISSIAIGIPGAVNNGRIFYIPGYEHFQDFDIKGYFEEHFSIPIVVENDMNAAVLGYYNDRRKNENQSLIYLYSGQNGPGAGIIVNGNVVRGSTFFSGEVSFVPQYDDRNFLQALGNRDEHQKMFIRKEHEIDAISRLVATFVAIINPHTIIFCNDEVNKLILEKIIIGSSKYIPVEHLPEITMSNWEQDYLYGLQSLGLEIMITGTSK
ncbi:ROK family protein [Psychrobacillus glaciei]|uniref:ROK family protein n=1 Tax=Psychrobacillus glaciei TaxID=2283160 RepID=A0A5J6ST30_9BACI|nr:ROK family protein [Psychrobacillus glaciei]QFG01157.1 ROK family protein [Psychrobacillus glaciei]